MAKQLAETELAPSRYVVGIDLGTTNSAVMYVDTAVKERRARVFGVPQVVAAGEVEARETLPSFHYQPAAGEMPGERLRLPWSKDEPNHAVGVFAREHGALVPGRMIASAKSWLCHSGVDRTAGLLPWHPAADVARLSPVEASARYLRHVREAWDHTHRDEPLAEQEIVLTLPASFDEVARELTVQAAAKAGLPRVVLIEEPQAAFYAWLDAHADDWQQQVEPGETILVCDIGGGTSDFTLIRAGSDSEGKVAFQRVAVGDHLILGGDNLDLALAKYLETRIATEGKLSPRKWDVLVASCRRVKEQLLGEDGPERITLTLPGAGVKLIGGGLQVEVTCDEVQHLLVDGFLPEVGLDAEPETRQSGFQEFGLPYAADAGITRYLAAFLRSHHIEGEPARPDIVLFNGGFFASPVLRDRLLAVLTTWFADEDSPDWQPRVITGGRLDLAVAHGAAYYGLVRRGEGVKIAAGLARSYYIGVESDPPAAVCLAPAGAESGEDIDLAERKFELAVSQPVEFPLLVSSTRLTDAAGSLVEISDEEMKPLPPIRTVLRARRAEENERIEVTLHARLTEIGTLEMWCAETAGRRRWQLQFDVRSATQTDLAGHEALAEREGFLDEGTWLDVHREIAGVFGREGVEKPAKLMQRLAIATGLPRDLWPTSLLRRMWGALMELDAGRRKSAGHETRWLNLLGFALRPGYGLAVDDWRVAETWRMVQGKLIHAGANTQNESLILWRRIGGGLSAGQQQAVAEQVLAPVRALHRRTTGGGGRGGDFGFRPHESAEVWRLLGSLELLPVELKIELGHILLDLLPKRKLQPVRPAMTWALGRLATRTPLYGPLNTVIPVETASAWIERMIALSTNDAVESLAVMQMARRTDDRYRDIDDPLRRDVADWLTSRDAPAHFAGLVQTAGALEDEEQDRIFGEALPKGLRLRG